jgi:hypothetical protein
VILCILRPKRLALFVGATDGRVEALKVLRSYPSIIGAVRVYHVGPKLTGMYLFFLPLKIGKWRNTTHG